MQHPLQQNVQAISRRAWWLILVYGACWFLAVVLLAGLALGVADYLWRAEDPALRYLATGVWLGVIGWATYRFLYPALTHRHNLVRTASLIERFFPRLGNRLSSALAFLEQSETDTTAGSVELRRAVVAQAVSDIQNLDLTACLDARRPRRAALVLFGVVAMAAMAVWFDASAAGLAATRLTRPGSRSPWPRWNNLVFVDPPRRLARGQDLELSVVDRKGRLPDAVTLYYQFQGEPGRVLKRTMKSRGERMVDRLDNITRPLRYRAVGGDHRSMPWVELAVDDPAEVVDLSIRLHPPSYTGWPAYPGDAHIRALTGTRVELHGRVDEPLAAAELQSNPAEVTGGATVHVTDDGYGLTVDEQSEEPWVVEQSGTYWLRLEDRRQLRTLTDQRWQVHAVSDEAPTVSLERPDADLSVTPEARVPLRALVKDDLAIARIELRYQRSDQTDIGEQVVVLYEQALEIKSAIEGDPLASGHSENVLHDWDLARIEGLEPGDSISLHVAASDHKPQTGQSSWRRLSIISADELEDHLARRRAELLSQLAEALQIQRQARSQVTALQIQIQTAGSLPATDIDHLQSAELNQRQVGQLLGSASQGLTTQITAFIHELHNNRVDSPEVERRMQELKQEIERLGQDHLPVIERQLLSALKSARAQQRDESDTAAAPAELQPPLAEAGSHQDEVITSLERLLGQLSQWDSYRRFSREISRLRSQQQELQAETQQLRLELLTKDLRDLQPQQLAQLRRLAERQFELARQLDKVQSRMQEMATELQDSEPLVAQTLADALDVALQAALSGQMRESGRRLEQNRIGQASDDQQRIADALEEMLDVLANRREHELARIADKLQNAAETLAGLESRQGELQEALNEAEQQGDERARVRELERLSRRQQELRDEAQGLTRQLERLQAQAPADAVRQAGEAMQQAAEAAEQQDAAAASQHAQEAREQLSQAQAELAQQRQQVQQDLFFEQLARLEQFIAGLAQQHRTIIDETRRLDRLRVEQPEGLTDAQRQSVSDLAEQERLIAAEASSLAADVAAANAFRLGLEGAASTMLRAADALSRHETGSTTQQTLEHAQTRLEQLLQALQPDPPGAQSGDQTPADPPTPPPLVPPQDNLHALAELKLLKLMQEEINRRTVELQGQRQPDGSFSPAQQQELQALSQEQGRLAELMLEFMSL